MLLTLLIACNLRTPTFACGKVICAQDEICLHWPTDTAEPPDAGHGCVAAPDECGAVPTCECAADVCLSDCEVRNGGLSCDGEEP